MKLIIFQEQFIPLIKDGKKTITRRLKTDLKQGDIAYFKAGRNGKKEGYIGIKDIRKENLQDLIYDRNIEEAYKELLKEGIQKPKKLKVRYPKIHFMLIEFRELWNKLNKKKWEDNPIIYRIEFEYLGDKL